MKNYIYNHESQPLEVQSVGISTARFRSMIVEYDQQRIIVPIGLSLAVYNFDSLNKIIQKQTNTSVVYALDQNESYIISVGFDGDIALLDKQTLEILHRLHPKIGNQCRWISTLDDLCAVSAERSQVKGSVGVYDLKQRKELFTIKGYSLFGTIVGNRLFVLKSTKSQQITKEEKASLTEKERVQKKHSQLYTYILTVYSIEGFTLIKEVPLELPPSDVLITTHNKLFIVYIFASRRIGIYNILLETFRYIELEGKGSFLSATIDDNFLIIPSKYNQLTYIDLNDLQILQKKIKMADLATSINVNHQTIVLSTESELSIQNGEKYISLAIEGITKCGIDFQENGNIVSGDFQGNISIHEKDTNKIINTISLGNIVQDMTQIRSIACMGNAILIGTMDGSLFTLYQEQFKMVKQLEGSVTCIRVKNHEYYASTTHGFVYRFLYDELIEQFLAHEPKQSSAAFGSLGLYAEVWSLALHPELNLIATGSEDQTVKIFHDQKSIAVLQGHTRAVTCLDWKEHQQNLLLYSCSDDQTVRIYNSDYLLVKVLDTMFINEWHTLTYMQVYENLICIGGQNGYLFIYDMEKNQFTFAQKVHMGGIEGLAVKNGILATCSSDNSTNIYKIK